MGKCSVLGYRMKFNKKHPNITLHRLPTCKKRENLLRIENINKTTKYVFIYSLHFEEKFFNRTLQDCAMMLCLQLPAQFEECEEQQSVSRRVLEEKPISSTSNYAELPAPFNEWEKQQFVSHKTLEEKLFCSTPTYADVTPLGAGSNSDGFFNKRGRPREVNIIRFGPQPQSMVSKLLLQLKAEKSAELKSPSPVNDSKLSPIEDYSKPKKKKKRKIQIPNPPKIYSCDFENCSYSTKQASNMTKHLRVHTGEKPFLCDRCSFRTNFVNSLKCHKRLHTSDRPYKCLQCSYSCNSASNLKKHLHTRHKTNESAKC